MLQVPNRGLHQVESLKKIHDRKKIILYILDAYLHGNLHTKISAVYFRWENDVIWNLILLALTKDSFQ